MDEKIDKLLNTLAHHEDSLVVDSRKVRPGDIFVAIRGTNCDSHDFVGDVIKKGARNVICEHKVSGLSIEDGKKVIYVENSQKTFGYMLKHLFGDPSGALKVYGVTGTNGKTTTTFLIDSILNKSGISSGLVGTVFTKTFGDHVSPSAMTTPDCTTLNRLLREMVKNDKRAASIEVSSHALSQDRIYGIGLDAAVFTNITPEHLDYHHDMATYLNDKSKIFQHLKPNGTAVLNVDDSMVNGLIRRFNFPKLITYGIEAAANVKAVDIQISLDETSFDLVSAKFGLAHIHTTLIGRHNVYNMLAAASALLAGGIGLDAIKAGLADARPVPGRLDKVYANAPFHVFVDYAHTPDALNNILLLLRSMTQKRLIAVFGCGGERDATKRPVMGEIAMRISDYVVLTNDNPRRESPDKILDEIERGMHGENYTVIQDRRLAIRKAIEIAKEGDIVVIAGKGHEDYQIIADKVLPFDDKKVASEILREIGY